MLKDAHNRPEGVEAMALRMRALRAATGLSQEQFAAKYGLSHKQWGNIETARSRIGIDMALILARELLVPLDWTYRGIEAWLPSDLRDKIRAEMVRAEQIAAMEHPPVRRGRPRRVP